MSGNFVATAPSSTSFDTKYLKPIPHSRNQTPTVMKTTLYSLLAAAACGMAFGQTTAYTTPVGYTTQNLPASTLSLVGFNVLPPALATGKFTGVSGANLTDSNVNFTTALPAGKWCVLEITSGTTVPLVVGTVQEFSAWSGNTITLPAAVTGVAIGDSYTIRVVPTLQETFPVGFLAGSTGALNADKVWVPNGSGGYTKYYYRITVAPTGWRITTTGSNDAGAAPADIPLTYIDGLVIEKKGTAKSLVLSGEVKKTGSNALAVITGLNPISIVAPVGLTLQSSGLQGDIASSTGALNADKVWVPNGSGGYTKYYHRITVSPTGWRKTTTGSNDTGAAPVSVPLEGAVLIERKGTAKVISFDVPSDYSNL